MHIFKLPSVRIQTLLWFLHLFDEYNVLKLLAYLQCWCWRGQSQRQCDSHHLIHTVLCEARNLTKLFAIAAAMQHKDVDDDRDAWFVKQSENIGRENAVQMKHTCGCGDLWATVRIRSLRRSNCSFGSPLSPGLPANACDMQFEH